MAALKTRAYTLTKGSDGSNCAVSASFKRVRSSPHSRRDAISRSGLAPSHNMSVRKAPHLAGLGQKA